MWSTCNLVYLCHDNVAPCRCNYLRNGRCAMWGGPLEQVMMNVERPLRNVVYPSRDNAVYLQTTL